MKYRFLIILFLLTLSISAQNKKGQVFDLLTPFEKSENTTATYHEAIDFYKKLARNFKEVTLTEFGPTDSGFPLHEVVVAENGQNNPRNIGDKAIVFINNAIHPGEPCGVDASMMFVRDLLTDQSKKELLSEMVFVIIPIYNISGALNRSSSSRANQNGPRNYGFRGNAQNRDLNRDFIKCDTENAKTFNKLYTKWKPHIFIDNHTSNGADYQYVMTLIPTQKDKMAFSTKEYMVDNMLPALYEKMANKGYEMTPYVYARTTPDEGIAGFLDLPRYSSGYASLFNAFSFMPETHMLKPFEDRVKSTYDFIESMAEHVSEKKSAILRAYTKAEEEIIEKKDFDLNWEMDMEKVDTITFKGYAAKYKPSEVSGLDRLYYDHEEPYTKRIPHFNTYAPNTTINKPKAYIIPQAYKQIVDRMKANGVKMERLEKDEVFNVEIYKIENFKTVDSPYEGHYLHRNLEVSKQEEPIQYYRGDYMVYTNQITNNYIIHTLEPQAPDSWFSWNFFDGILMQKEHFSPYVFEDMAAQMLKENPSLKKALEDDKLQNPDLAKNGYAQLNFIYERSPYYEPTFKRYPIGRLK